MTDDPSDLSESEVAELRAIQGAWRAARERKDYETADGLREQLTAWGCFGTGYMLWNPVLETPEHRQSRLAARFDRYHSAPICGAIERTEMEDSHEMLTFHEEGGFKACNPKDMIGIRKAPMSTVSGAVLAEVGVAMLEGAAKYGRHNYRAVGVSAAVYYDATMRHLMGWWEGEDIDPDSGLSHVTKAIASLVVLRDAMIQSMLTDDRPPRSVPIYADLNARASSIVDRYADRSPVHYTITFKGTK